MKYKKLTKEQLLISFDRLTRFKPTKEKYLRVFSDIILPNLSEPAYKKNDLINMPAEQITKIATEIINASLDDYNDKKTDEKNINLNQIIKEYENSVFINDKSAQEFLDNNIRYDLLVPLINESCPINLRWLKIVYENYENGNSLIILRRDNGLKYPIQKLLLVEGITEEILLPVFSKYLGFDFYKEGVQILAAGGKNQVVKMYYKLVNEIKIPIYVLLDKDAEENISQIKPKLRKSDKIHLLSCGEFEDLLSKSLIIKTVNSELSNFASVNEIDFDPQLPTAKNLENIFKTKGLHEFKKADFAKLVKDNISEDSDISPEVTSIIKEIGL